MQGEASPEQNPNHLIPPEVKTFIDSESEKSRMETLQYLDEDSAETQGQLTRDLKTGEYIVLKWLDEQYGPGMVFYPGSGSDRIPKDVFGENRVVHVSLEEFAGKSADGKKRGKKHFEELKKGMRVIADIDSTPLRDSSTDVVILLESSFVEEPRYIEELTRVLKKGGIMLLSKDFMFYENDEERKPKRRELMNMSDSLIFERVPPGIDYHGEDVDIEYYILRKS